MLGVEQHKAGGLTWSGRFEYMHEVPTLMMRPEENGCALSSLMKEVWSQKRDELVQEQVDTGEQHPANEPNLALMRYGRSVFQGSYNPIITDACALIDPEYDWRLSKPSPG